MAIYLGNTPIAENVTIQQGSGVTIDDTLSDTSKNPVQNKVINAALNSKANLSDIPTSLPADGGNADTLGGKHANDFALAENKFLDDFFSSKSGDIRALVIDLPSGGFGGNTGRLPNITGFPITGDILIIWSKSVYSNGFRYGTLQVRSMTQSNLPVYQCSVYNDGVYTEWQKLCDGGNADTLDGKHASDFALKTDIPTSLPANGGMANTARETVSPNAKALLWEDGEGGNLKLVSPDGNHSVEMDLFNNEGFRMYFTDNGELTFPVDYNSTTKKFNINGNADSVDGIHITTADDGHTYDWLACFTSTNEIRAINPDRAYVKNAGNADTANFATHSDYAGGSVQSTASNACLRNISAGTADLSAGVSELATGTIYLVYE